MMGTSPLALLLGRRGMKFPPGRRAGSKPWERRRDEGNEGDEVGDKWEVLWAMLQSKYQTCISPVRGLMACRRRSSSDITDDSLLLE